MKSGCSLSIRFGSDGFSLFILDQAGNALIQRRVSEPLFQMQKDEIISLFETQSGINPVDYSEIQLVVESDVYVFVPAPIFNIQHIDDYFYFQHPKVNRQIVLFDRVENWDAVNVFSVPAQLNEALSQLFPDTAVRHQLSYFLSEKIRTKADGVYIWMRPKIFDAVVVNSKTLTLLNSFAYNTAEDVAFFVLSIFDQLKLDTETTAVQLYQRNNSDKLKELIASYVKKIYDFRF
jgi:hypothetical protein